MITSHGWADETSRARIQALGGFVSPNARNTNDYIAEWRKARAGHSTAYLRGFWIRHRHERSRQAPAPRPGAATEDPVTYPFSSFDGGVMIQQSQWGTRSWDFNLGGASHYGLFIGWIEDLRHVAWQEIVDDLGDGAEAYLQMWERASSP